MSSWHQTTLATLGNVSVTLGDLLRKLHLQGNLLSVLKETVIEQFVVAQAAQVGLTASTAELQAAADQFRTQNRLLGVEDTQAWLARRQLSLVQFETGLEHELLVNKLKDHVTRDRIAEHFSANQAGYCRANLRLIETPREDLAREIITQFQSDGRDFGELAAEHSRHASKTNGGRIGLALRCQLPEPLASAIFTSEANQVVGPFAAPDGFQLFLVEAFFPPELDATLTAHIREELFALWLRSSLPPVTPQLAWLDEL